MRQILDVIHVLLLMLSALAFPCDAQTPEPSPANSSQATEGKKLIEWGWDEPDARFLLEHAAEMQRLAFDGVVFHLTAPGHGNVTWQLWGGTKFQINDFQQVIQDLLAADLGRLTDNFIRLNVTPGTADWFDDSAWKEILHNTGLVAQVAQQGGCRGILFDTEQYQGEPFNYRQQPPRPLDDYRAQVRKRGREWIQAVNTHFPNVTIFLSFAYQTAQPKPGQAPADTRYALLPDFLDGILEACSEETILIDGWEQSYSYTRSDQFEQARQTMTRTALEWTAVPERYRRHLQPAFGLWMDNNLKADGWHPDDFARNYFTPPAFEQALRSALRITDRYVWIYTEQPRWWTGENLPDAYIQAVRASREPEHHTESPAARRE